MRASLFLLVLAIAPSGLVILRNQGRDLGFVDKINCGTNVTCSIGPNGQGTITADAGGGGTTIDVTLIDGGFVNTQLVYCRMPICCYADGGPQGMEISFNVDGGCP